MDARPTSTGRGRGAVLVVGAVLALAACGSDSSDATRSVASAPSGTAAGPATVPAATSMRGERYCEVLLVDVVDGLASADVYVSYPLNDCPADRWSALDPASIAAAEGTTAAVLNGPRNWLMDQVTKDGGGATGPTKDFGGIEMRLQASVQIGSLAGAGQPYVTREVDRSTVFTFGAGQTVYELRAPDGSTYVMQSWSQQKDPALVEADLDELGTRLQPPAGWSYGARVLDEPLVVDTTATTAKVLQDELANSYSYVAT